MTHLGDLPTRMQLEIAYKTYFSYDELYLAFPAVCKCGEAVKNLTGSIIHLRKKHGVYIIRRKSRRAKAIHKLINQ